MSNERASWMVFLGYAIIMILGVIYFTMHFPSTSQPDLLGQSRICAYAIRGVNPYYIINTPNELSSYLGDIPVDFTASPWGLLLGNLFYPGFSSGETALKYYKIACVVTILVTALILCRTLCNAFSAPALASLVCLCLLSISYWDAFRWGNAGGMIGCFLLISCLISKKHPYVTGILLSFAMIKPQMAVPFCLAFLITKRWRGVLVAAIIDIAAWIAISIVLNTDVVTLLRDFLGAGIGEERNGIFSFFASSAISPKVCLLASMAFGLIYFAGLSFFGKNKKPIHVFSYAAITASFWSYINETDKFCLIIPCIILVSILCSDRYRALVKTESFIFSLFLVFCLFIRDFISSAAPFASLKAVMFSDFVYGSCLVLIGIAIAFQPSFKLVLTKRRKADSDLRAPKTTSPNRSVTNVPHRRNR